MNHSEKLNEPQTPHVGKLWAKRVYSRHPLIGVKTGVNFGRPMLLSRGLDAHIITNRFMAKESVLDLAQDYGISTDDVLACIRFELDVARTRIPRVQLQARP